MSSLRFTNTLGMVALALALSSPPARSADTGACAYAYLDSFSTSKADSESISHSPIVDGPPPGLSFYGLLTYTSDPTGNRGLTFLRGWEVEAWAYLRYRFPVRGEVWFTAGTLAFEIAQEPTGFQPWSVRLEVSYEGTSGEFTRVFTELGHYQIALTPGGPSPSVRVSFVGTGITLDDLVVCLDHATDVQPRTWGQLKQRYR